MVTMEEKIMNKKLWKEARKMAIENFGKKGATYFVICDFYGDLLIARDANDLEVK